MCSHHEPLKALGPVTWGVDIDASHSTGLDAFVANTLFAAQTVVNSIPSSAPEGPEIKVATARSRSVTDGNLVATSATSFTTTKTNPRARRASSPEEVETISKLRREWREVKLGGENPHNMRVWKLPGKDGKGAWFARRSLHSQFGFRRWKLGLEREFDESLRVQRKMQREGRGGQNGFGKVRGIGAEKRVEKIVVKGQGKIEVYQLSAKFPGPAVPRDFVALLVTSDSETGEKLGSRPPRQFMVVSKPCKHPQCPQRSGFTRGQYESVEVIREVPIERPVKRTRSSADPSSERPAQETGRDEMVAEEVLVGSALQRAASHKKRQGQGEGEGIEDDEPEYAVEWLMVTRSDPGGSVPRFLVERGTSGAIVSDANKLVKWLASKRSEDEFVSEEVDETEGGAEQASETEEQVREQVKSRPSTDAPIGAKPKDHAPCPVNHGSVAETSPPPGLGVPSWSGGLYGLMTVAMELSGSFIVSRLSSLSRASASNEGGDSDDKSDTNEKGTATDSDYASAEEGGQRLSPVNGQANRSDLAADRSSSCSSSDRSITERSGLSNATTGLHETSVAKNDNGAQITLNQALAQHNKGLRRMEKRHARLQEKMAREQEKALARMKQDSDRDARLREKHERERAKQEDKFKQEVERLERKRREEERRAEARKRRTREKEEKGDMARELERARAERDVARKQLEALKCQVGALQAQNTKLVVEMGRMRSRGEGSGESVASRQTGMEGQGVENPG